MSYFLSQMHFDESVESIADCDLENGEIRKLLNSPQYAQRASGKPDAMVVQEREVSAQMSHSSDDRRASGRPAALFLPKRNEQRNQMWSSVFGNANLSCLSGTLLEGNEDHLLNQARSDLAKRELHVESPNKCIDVLQKRTEAQNRAPQDVQNEFVESCREQTRLQEELSRKEKALRDTQIRSMHELEKMQRAQVQQVDEFSIQTCRENHETIQLFTFQLQQMQEQMNSMNSSGEFREIESNHSGRLSHVSSQREMIPSSRALLSRDKRLPLDTWSQSGVQENVFGNQFSTFDSPSDFPQRISSDDVQRNREAVPLDLQSKAKTSLTSEDGQNYGTIPLLMFASRPLTEGSKHPVDIPQNYLVGQQRQQISELQLDRFLNPSSFLVWKTRFKTQVSSGSDFPSEAMLWIKEVEMVDSLDELTSSRSVHGRDFPNFEMLDAKIASALNKITQKSQFKKRRLASRGAESPKSGPVSERETKSPP